MKSEVLIRQKRTEGLKHLALVYDPNSAADPIVNFSVEAKTRRGIVLQEFNITPEQATPGADLEALEVIEKDFELNNETLEAFEATNMTRIDRALWRAHRQRGAEKHPVKLETSVKKLLDKTVVPGRVWVGEYAMISKETEAGIRPVYRAIIVKGRFNGGFRPLYEEKKKAA